MPLSCLASVPRDTGGFGGAGSPPPPCQGAPSPSSATLSRSPGDSQTPFQGHEGLCAILGSERGVSDKGGSGGGGWCSSSFPAGTKAKQTESVSVSVSVPIPCPCPCPWPYPCPRSSQGWCGGGQCPGGGHRAPPALGPRGHPSPAPARSHLGSAQGPPRSPLAAGIGAMAFQLEERWRWQRVLGATSCRLSVLPVSPWWLRRGPGPPGCPIPDGWVAPRRWHRPHGPTGSSGVPRATEGARQESPAAGAGSGRGEAAWRGSVGAVTCHRAPGYPETCRSTRLKQASMRGRRAGGEGHPIHREKVPQRQGWGGWRGHAARGRGGVSSVTRSGGVRGPIQPPPPPKNKHPPLAHPWEHPLVPRSILGGGAVRPLGTGAGGAGCGRGGVTQRRLPTLGFHDVRSSVRKGLAGHREEHGRWRRRGGNLHGTRGGSDRGRRLPPSPPGAPRPSGASMRGMSGLGWNRGRLSNPPAAGGRWGGRWRPGWARERAAGSGATRSPCSTGGAGRST